jgi:indolepyruvate decarboxylase
MLATILFKEYVTMEYIMSLVYLGILSLDFINKLIQSNKLKVINTCDEQGAGFAADAYACINRLGAVCVTYCVGGLKVVNTTVQAFAEKSPVVVISGAPGIKERRKNPLAS